MKSPDEMTGAQKAAALIVAMGPEAASEIMKYMDEESVVKLSSEIAKIDRLSFRDREELIGEFMVKLKKINKELTGGEAIAKKLLTDAFGDEKAESVMSRMRNQDAGAGFDFLADADPQVIADMTSKEHPQIIAVMIAHLPPAVAGKVMKLYSEEIAKDTAVRIARMGKISPESVVAISASLKKKYEQYQNKTHSGNTPGGLDTLAGIMNHLGGEAEMRLMNHLDDQMPEFATEIRRKISFIEFESVIMLSNREIRLVLEKISENRIIAKALKGCSDDIRFKVLRNMSTHRAEDVVGLMDSMGPVRISEVTEARQQIVDVMKELNGKGLILIRRSGEEYIE
ncbi:MAG: flagellar motor switch protein FliG [Spirochaetota bacterium]